MFRKTVLALAACASLGAAALAPTAASAHWYGHHHYRFFFPHVRYYAPVYSACSWQKQWYNTYYGPRFRWIKVCG